MVAAHAPVAFPDPGHVPLESRQYCRVCRIHTPPRAKHCRTCDSCIAEFDHHCPWVGNCVGARNYRFFVAYVVCTAGLALYIFSSAAAALLLRVARERDRGGAASSWLDALVAVSAAAGLLYAVGIFSACLVGPLTCLSVYHLRAVGINATTFEQLRASRLPPSTPNPHDLGSCPRNCAARLCSPLPPSLVAGDARDDEEEEEQVELGVAAPPAAARIGGAGERESLLPDSSSNSSVLLDVV